MCSSRRLQRFLHQNLLLILLASRPCRSQADLDFGSEETLESNMEMEEDTTSFPLRSLPRASASSCRLSEMLCDTGQCISLDKYCNGEDDCGDKSDEPKFCTPCNRTYIGDVGRTYELEVRRPREEHLPFLCHLNFTAAGGDYGNLVQLTFDTFTVGKFVSFTTDGCPDGHMTIRERSPAPPMGQWCGSAWGYTVYFSESDSVNMTLRLDRLSQQGVGYNFDFKLAYKFLWRSEAKLRYGNSSVGAWRGDRVPGTYCDRLLSDCDLRPCRIQSPNFPGVYPRNATCTYRIEHTRVVADKHALLAVRQTNSHKIHIKDQIVKYDRSQRVLKLWDQCNVVQDYLTVWDGTTKQSPVLARLCGGDAVPDIVSRGPHMLLEFHTSPYDNPFHPVPLSYLPGFELEVQVVLVDRESHSYVRADGHCRFVLRSSDATSGVLRNPRHSLPPNTTCIYYFQGRTNEIVWVSFVKYHAAGGEPAGFDQQKDCSSQLSIWDGSAPDLDLDDKEEASEGSGGGDADGSLLGSFCREESPRLCDHALLANATRATRPCAPAESYVTVGPALTIVQELRQGSALYPVSFVLRYEFVDVSQQGQPIAGSHTACDRVFRSSHTFSGRFQSPRSIFYYGRGGAQNLTCILRFESKPGERVRLTFNSAHFGNKRCYSHQDPRTGRWRCDRSHRWSYPGGGDGFAQIVITEYPWEGVPLTRDCLCINRTEPLTILTLTAPVVEVNFTVVMMNITEDYDDFSFEGEYRFVASGPGDEAVCSSSWGERRLRGSSGEIRLLDPHLEPHGSSEVFSDRNIVSESVRAEGATPCVHRAWLIEPGGDEVPRVPAGYLFLKLNGYELTPVSAFCPTTNRVLIYDARNTTRPREICPTSGSSSTAATVELFSPGWDTEDTSPEAVLQPHGRSFIVEFLQREPAEYTIKWIEVTKRPNFIPSNSISSSPAPTASLSMDCPYSCPELNACIPPSLWCDGAAHCPSGFDEEDSNCSFRLGLPPPYLAAAAGAALLVLVLLVVICACRCRRRSKEKAKLKARLDGAVPCDGRSPFDGLQPNGTAAGAEKGLRPPDHHKYATIQKYATLDKYSLSQKYCAGLNDARYYDEVARRDKLADARYASLGRGGGGGGGAGPHAHAHGSHGSARRLPPERAYPDLKDGFC